MKFRKRPIEVEAEQFGGSYASASFIRQWSEGQVKVGTIPLNRQGEYHLMVPTREGVMSAKPGDWIIKGWAGEFYPCDKAIFEGTYDRVEPLGPLPPMPRFGIQPSQPWPVPIMPKQVGS